jgi:hypothetical protein
MAQVPGLFANDNLTEASTTKGPLVSQSRHCPAAEST